MSKKDILYGPDVYKRNEHGLLENITYKFNEDGSIDWRSMIKPDFLYPNKDWFDSRKKQLPDSIEGLKDNQLLIMLGGIKELAKMRGYSNVSFDVQNVADGYVTAKCTISWNKNYETEEATVYTDYANATFDNTDAFCAKFLEAIACNRAFVRCVRNYLNIHIVGADELDRSKLKPVKRRNKKTNYTTQQESSVFAISAATSLEKALHEELNIVTFEGFKELLRDFWTKELYKNNDAKDWGDFADIPAKECRLLLSLVKSQS